MLPNVSIQGGAPMTEAIHLHDELAHALQLLIPQTTYQDLRRLNTLAWAITGL